MSSQLSFYLYSNNATIRPASTSNPRLLMAPSVPVGKRLVLRVPIPSEAWLQRVTVYQESGTSVAFTIEALASSLPYGDGTTNQVTDAVGAAPAVPVAPFRVLQPIASTSAGSTLDWRAAESAGGANGVPCLNMDQVTRAVPQSFLYLVVFPTSAVDATTWCITVVLAQQTSF